MRMGSTGRRRDQLCRNWSEYSLQSSIISPHYLREENVLGDVVRESVVNLDGMHHEDVADDGDDELRVPVRVAWKQILSNLRLCHISAYTVYLLTSM